MIGPARTAALDALRAVHEDRAALPDALAAIRERLADPRDVALASEILIGTLRWRGTLDHLIAARSSRPLDRLDPVVLDIVRSAAYQLLHLDRVPPSAAVNDAVALSKASGHAAASGFVNAVLRRLADPKTRPPLPATPTGDDRRAWVRYLATRWSHPEWLVARWLDRIGRRATEARLHYDQSPAPVTLRARKTAERDLLLTAFGEADVVTEAARFAPGALRVVSGNPWHAALPAGLFVVQDEASQLVARFAGPERDQRVLDACASPGGKATLMADLMESTGLIVAADLRRARMRLLREAVGRSGAGNVRLVRHDAATGLPYRRALRPGPGRRAVLGPRHVAPRPRREVAPRRVRPRGVRRRGTTAAQRSGERGQAGWPAGLRHVLERARRERRRRQVVPRHPPGFSSGASGSCLAGLPTRRPRDAGGLASHAAGTRRTRRLLRSGIPAGCRVRDAVGAQGADPRVTRGEASHPSTVLRLSRDPARR